MTERQLRNHPLRGLRLEAWPMADRTAWLAALAPGDRFDPGGARAHLRPASNANVRHVYARWLSWLIHTGRMPPEGDNHPADRLTPDAVAAHLADIRSVNSTGTAIQAVAQLYAMARVMDPRADWSWMLRLNKEIRLRHVAVRDKVSRMKPAGDLFALGERLMQEAGGLAGWQRALRFRDGLIIAILALRPIRISNFAALQLGRHLDRRGDEWWVAIPDTETKTHTLIEFPLPAAINLQLGAYLTEHRPILLKRAGVTPGPQVESANLWLSKEGLPMATQAFRKLIRIHTKAAFGVALTPHLFRDCAVTSLALADPGHVGLASRLLGHNDQGTTERNYNQAKSFEAAERVQRVMADRLLDAGAT